MLKKRGRRRERKNTKIKGRKEKKGMRGDEELEKR